MSDFTEKVRAMLDKATQGQMEAMEFDGEIVVGMESFLENPFHYTSIHKVVVADECIEPKDQDYAEAMANAELFAAAPTLLREACERIEALERVVEAARAWDKAHPKGCKSFDVFDVVRTANCLRDALSDLDAKEQS